MESGESFLKIRSKGTFLYCMMIEPTGEMLTEEKEGVTEGAQASH